MAAVEQTEVSIIRNPQHLSEAQVLEHLNKEGNVIWTTAGELEGDQDDACVDDREQEPIIGTPGGDIGLLAKAIEALPIKEGEELSATDIHNILRWYSEENGTFYHHTDTHGLEHLMADLNNDPHTPNFETLEELEIFLRNPDRKYQIKLLNFLTNTDNIGCGHIKLMLLNPEAYNVNPLVIVKLISGFFDAMWNEPDGLGKNMKYRVLEGDHDAGAVVNIILDTDKIDKDTPIPMVRPKDTETGLSMFINHPQVAQYKLKSLAQSLFELDIIEKIIDKDQALKHMEEMENLLDNGTKLTVAKLGFGLPIINALIKKG